MAVWRPRASSLSKGWLVTLPATALKEATDIPPESRDNKRTKLIILEVVASPRAPSHLGAILGMICALVASSIATPGRSLTASLSSGWWTMEFHAASDRPLRRDSRASVWSCLIASSSAMASSAAALCCSCDLVAPASSWEGTVSDPVDRPEDAVGPPHPARDGPEVSASLPVLV